MPTRKDPPRHRRGAESGGPLTHRSGPGGEPSRRAPRGLLPLLRRRLPAARLVAARRGDRPRPSADALGRGPGHRVGPALRLAEPAPRRPAGSPGSRSPTPSATTTATARSSRCARADFREVPIFGDDGALRDEEIIRITDIGFPESVLLDTDAWLCELLRRPEFQRRMTGCEFRNLLGCCYAARRAGRQRAARACSRSAGARRSRSSSARPPTAACS